MNRIARVRMPERGVFSVRCPEGFSGCAGDRVVVALDYGRDVGELLEVAVYDPARDGARPPGFALERRETEADRARQTRNDRRALRLRQLFGAAARTAVPDLRVPYARLSLGGERLFLRYVCERPRPDLSAVIAVLREREGVSVNAWQMGPRDEVRELGALGPCGRACCCCTWQRRYPTVADGERRHGGGPAADGVCGRLKCCLGFEPELPK